MGCERAYVIYVREEENENKIGESRKQEIKGPRREKTKRSRHPGDNRETYITIKLVYIGSFRSLSVISRTIYI